MIVKLKFLKVQLIVLFLTFAFLSCQDSDIPSSSVDEIDQDMELATQLADDYIKSMLELQYTNSSSSRQPDNIDKIDKSITVLKYKNGQLVYNTNTDTIRGYQSVGETTITAWAEPGEYIFWFAGGGVTSLDSIDFDNESLEFLDELPMEIRNYHSWVLQIPEDFDTERDYLKYDIVYQTKESAGVSIRLDPKIAMVPGRGRGRGRN